MKKVVVFCNSDILAIPVISDLWSKGLLKGIVVPDYILENLSMQLMGLSIDGPVFKGINKQYLHSEEFSQWLNEIEPDLIVTLTFPWKLPKGIRKIAHLGAFNFHFGLLPKYGGADPIFWQIRNREKQGGIMVHRMTESIDSGPIVIKKEIAIIPGENYGLHAKKLGIEAVHVFKELITKLEERNTLEEVKNTEQVNLMKNPSQTELIINWSAMSAESIENLVNASNPKYDGAKTLLNDMPCAVYEVSPAQINENQGDTPPGQIVYADNVYGLIVACADGNFLKIGSVKLQEGYFTGSKLFNLGINQNHRFS